jgi:Transposase zinc-binding domain
MTTLRAICTAFAPESLERYPQLPLAHRTGIRAIQQCRSGPYGHRLYACPSCGGQHCIQHACGHRHWPQGQQHKTRQWRQHHLEHQLPGPYVLLTCTVPAMRRPFLRSHQRPASQALCHASATALNRLAQA